MASYECTQLSQNEQQIAILQKRKALITTQIREALLKLRIAHETGVDVENAITAYTDKIREQRELEEMVISLQLKQGH